MQRRMPVSSFQAGDKKGLQFLGIHPAKTPADKSGNGAKPDLLTTAGSNIYLLTE